MISFWYSQKKLHLTLEAAQADQIFAQIGPKKAIFKSFTDFFSN